jgi:3-methylcrotonyl-CoA carboxylase alpha subunit
LRQDTGVEAGDEVSTYYDPMLGKIVAWGDSRTTAIERLQRALGEIEIAGVETNRALLSSVLADAEFRRAAVATDFLNVRRAHLRFGEAEATDIDSVLAAVWCAARRTDANALWADTRGWRPAAPSSTVWRFGSRSVTLDLAAPDRYLARTGAKEMTVQVVSRDAESLSADCDGEVRKVHVFEAPPVLHLYRAGLHAALTMVGTDDALQAVGGAEQGSLLTPLPGTIVALHVTAGDRVARGAPLITVEAMKMEHTLTAPYDGVVSRVAFGLADRVQAGAVLVELAPL